MSTKFSFQLGGDDKKRPLPHKIIIGMHGAESESNVLLKLLGFLLFFRERLLVEPHLHLDHIPFVPDLVELDFQLHPKFWVECGECDIKKLNKLAVKVPESELWILRHSLEEAEELLASMRKHKLRTNRYDIIGFDMGVFDEIKASLTQRNEIFWVGASFDPFESQMQFDFNGLWFELPFKHIRH